MIVAITTFTLIHTVLSVVGIFAGLVVVGGLIAGSSSTAGPPSSW
jgi:hypothetical protein